MKTNASAHKHVFVLLIVLFVLGSVRYVVMRWLSPGASTSVTGKPLSLPSGWYTARNTPGTEQLTKTPSLEELTQDIVIQSDGSPCVVWSRDNTTLTQADLFFACWDTVLRTWHGKLSQTGPDQITSTANINEHPSMALDSQGRPHIAWQEATVDAMGQTNGSTIRYLRWNGSAWRGFTGAIDTISTTNIDFMPALAINPQTQLPAVVWQFAEAFAEEVRYREWSGSAWVGKLGSAPDQINAGEQEGYCMCSLAFSLLGTPHVVWATGNFVNQAFEIHYRRWDGSSWRGLLSPGSDNVADLFDSGSMPALAMQNETRPAVVFVATKGQQRMVVYRRWDGSSWRGETGDPFDEVTGTYGESYFDPVLAFTAQGKPVAAWTHTYGTPVFNDIEVARYTGGSNWSGYSGVPPEPIVQDATDDAMPALVLDGNGFPVIAWKRGPDPHSDIFFTHRL